MLYNSAVEARKDHILRFYTFNNQIRRFRWTGHLELIGLKLITYRNFIRKPHRKRLCRRRRKTILKLPVLHLIY
jgi:hypothetical protein